MWPSFRYSSISCCQYMGVDNRHFRNNLRYKFYSRRESHTDKLFPAYRASFRMFISLCTAEGLPVEKLDIIDRWYPMYCMADIQLCLLAVMVETIGSHENTVRHRSVLKKSVKKLLYSQGHLLMVFPSIYKRYLAVIMADKAAVLYRTSSDIPGKID